MNLHHLACSSVLVPFLAACGADVAPPKPPQSTAATSAKTAPVSTLAVAPLPAPTASQERPVANARPVALPPREQALLDAWNSHDASRARAFYANEALVLGTASPYRKGRDAIEGDINQWFIDYPDFKVTPRMAFGKGYVFIAMFDWVGTDARSHKRKEWAVAVVRWHDSADLIKEEHLYINDGPLKTAPPFAVVFSKEGDPETTNTESIKPWYRSFETKSENGYLSLFTDTTAWNDMSEMDTRTGTTAARGYFRDVLKAFPDGKIPVWNTWAFEDWVVSEVSLEGTQRAPYHSISPSNRALQMDKLDVVRMKDNKIVQAFTFGANARSAPSEGSSNFIPWHTKGKP